MERIGIIFGGRSGEHEISLMSATSVIREIDKTDREIVLIGITKEGKWLLYDGPIEDIESGKWEDTAQYNLNQNPDKYSIILLGSGGKSICDLIDFAIPVVHGPYCEDGTLQGLLEMLDIPYAGCHVAPSAVAMDKLIAKDVFKSAGLPLCEHVAAFSEEIKTDIERTIKNIEKQLAYPVYVKPANMGSSVGVHKATDSESLKEALMDAIKYDRRLIVEEGIDCREIETGVIGNIDLQASVTGEIVATEDFYDYAAKYIDDGKPKMSIPADIPADISDKIREYALRAYKAIDGAGYARVDFFLDKKTGKIYLNEINTIPGFTKFSMFPLLWAATGVPYKDIIERVIGLGYERYYAKNNR